MPDIEVTTYSIWDAEDSIVMVWLINLMEHKIGRTYIFYKTAKAIWEAVEEIYSNMENNAQCVNLDEKLITYTKF